MNKLKKPIKIILDILLYIFIALCLAGVVISVVSKKDDDGTATVFGYQLRFVQSPSMERCDETYESIKEYDVKDIKTKSLVIIKSVPEDEEKKKEFYSSLRVGDVLTFKYVYTKQETITHRITKIQPKGEGYIITLEGDNKASDSETLKQTIDTTKVNSPDYIVGKVVGVSYPLGLFVYALKTPVGLVCIIIVPCVIIIIMEILRIVGVLSADKKKAQKDKEEKQQAELDELKRRLAELEGEKAESKEENKPD